MGQQFYVIRNNPQPGTPAHEAKLARQAAKDSAKAPVSTDVDIAADAEATTRVQPKKTSRAKRKSS